VDHGAYSAGGGSKPCIRQRFLQILKFQPEVVLRELQNSIAKLTPVFILKRPPGAHRCPGSLFSNSKDDAEEVLQAIKELFAAELDGVTQQ